MSLSERLDNILYYQQDEYVQLINSIISIRARKETPMAFIKTYGCQQNIADGEKIKGMLFDMGYGFTNTPEEADFILFNTCAIREHAEYRIFGNVGALKALKKRYPSTLIALCGCMMEQERIVDKIKVSFPFVGLIFGTHSLHKFPELLYNALSKEKRVIESGIPNETITEGIPTKRDGTIKAWIPVMYGCNNFCSYCIVPYVRGREKSRRPKDIIKEAKDMIHKGYKEITLLGQNVNSYGKNLDEEINFSKLLREIDSIEGDYCIRFMTSHPKDATKELIDTIAQSKHICHQLHLPVQSGNDRILKEMNRKYTREKYIGIINYAKSKIPDIEFTSDIIVGFPGETYEEFCDTLSLIKEVGFTSLFTFIYSKRPGTPAAKMQDPISYEEKSKWFRELLKEQEKISAAYCLSMLYKTYRVLFDRKNEKNNHIIGRTQGNIIVETLADEKYIGKFFDVKIIKAGNFIVKGELVKQ